MIQTDVPTIRKTGKPRSFFRHRGRFFKDFFSDTGAKPGDTVVFERLSKYQFRLHLEKIGGGRISNPIDLGSDRKAAVADWVLRETRPEQQRFRQGIVNRDGLGCAVTGCTTSAVLDAAHIIGHAVKGSDDPANGVILRADVHRLFDAGLLGFDKASRRVWISNLINDPAYLELEGKTVMSLVNLAGRAAKS